MQKVQPAPGASGGARRGGRGRQRSEGDHLHGVSGHAVVCLLLGRKTAVSAECDYQSTKNFVCVGLGQEGWIRMMDSNRRYPVYILVGDRGHISDVHQKTDVFFFRSFWLIEFWNATSLQCSIRDRDFELPCCRVQCTRAGKYLQLPCS